ncbi:acyl-CoA dehydrogenase family protein [Streptomyces himalayensis]|uniref:Acyl-CoA/acyl-ACP dehydrogenase n=1 Tax=Streptomyces himalayensis subsp. himalayensis TaxID=2756131 RepID=A0A7W0DIJ8_9ACTN|nr:acyl-CoA dehydrogenase family protein [Streptomyces himalayensis]MBA2945762.1 acyl-CoA/acyl-ACP dehydrogenase [Streptomyces himalayensis subsp. himalayensis]
MTRTGQTTDLTATGRPDGDGSRAGRPNADSSHTGRPGTDGRRTSHPDEDGPLTGRPDTQGRGTDRSALALPPLDLDRLPDVARGLADRAAEHDRDASFPTEGIALVHEAGLLTATVAPRYGGPGAGLFDTVRILRALGAGDPAVALVTAMTLFVHAGEARNPSWPAAGYAEFLTEAATRPALVNALRVEPELGSPVRGGLPATTARRDGDHWVLTGRKIYSTGAVGLSRMLVYARTDEDPVRVGSFLVRGDSPGLSIEPTWDHVGLRASRSDDVLLDGVRVPVDEVVGLTEARAAAPGARQDAAAGAWNALGLTALYLGVADAARDWLIGFLHERVPTGLGAALATLPRFETAVGEIESALTGAAVLVESLAARVDAGDPDAPAQAGIAKVLGTRAAIGAVEQALQLTGNHGLTRANPLQRHYRDVLCSRVHTPQDDAVVTAVGRAALDHHRPTAVKGT